MQNDFFDDLPPRKTLREFFAQVGPRTGELPIYLRRRGGLEPARPSPVMPPPGPLFAIPTHDDAPAPNDDEAAQAVDLDVPFE
jgi:hypothetical protein